MKYNILFGGKAGQGTNILNHLLAESLVDQGFYTFYYRDYQSLIRGGHNFNVLTFSDKPVHSNESKYDLIVALDDNTIKFHKKNLKKNGSLISGKDSNMYFAGKIFKIFGLEFSSLDKALKKLKKRYKENILEAKKGYEDAKIQLKVSKIKKQKLEFSSGSLGITTGAIKSGIDIYYAYPMTPATGVLTELAQKQKENNFLVLELENEIAVANAGIGSSITGAKTMVGTSGGGFDLMTEALSMAGIIGSPLVFYLAQRAGPASGAATYNSQGDLHLARHAGHGEFSRLVLAPGDPTEAEELTSQAFYFSQKFKIPSIILSDKHLAESFYSTNKKSKITNSIKSIKFGRYNSYEKDPETGSATEDKKTIKSNVEARLKIGEQLKKEAEKFPGYKIYGKKNSKNCILFWGSTKGAIIDAIENLDVCAIQILYVEPLPRKIESLLKNKSLILIENNVTGQLGDLIREKTGIKIDKKILRYDARPFLCDELKEQIKENLKK